MTTTFYAPPSAIQAGWVTLPADEAHHAVRVLRQKPGDKVIVVDGEGGWYQVQLETVDKKGTTGKILHTRMEVGEPAYHLTIGLALLKQRARFETFLEKAVEMGVRTVIPLQTTRTERHQLKIERARQIVIAATKQCGRSRLMQITSPQPLPEALRMLPKGCVFMAHEQIDPAKHLTACLRETDTTVSVLVGPEGGFTPAEVQLAEQMGAYPVSLGPRRLRAETAAMVGATIVMATIQ